MLRRGIFAEDYLPGVALCRGNGDFPALRAAHHHGLEVAAAFYVCSHLAASLNRTVIKKRLRAYLSAHG